MNIGQLKPNAAGVFLGNLFVLWGGPALRWAALLFSYFYKRYSRMLTDSDRFAFLPRRIHGFASTGNAYDACQVDEAIKTGHTLIILSEGVVGLAGTWPIAVTATGGVLHSVIGKNGDTLDGLSAHFDLTPDDILTAVTIAQAFGFALDPVFNQVCP